MSDATAGQAPPAVVLLSGGLDSATALACCVRDGFAPHALSFDYGQRHRQELEAARRVADAGGAVRHETVALNLSQFGGSALTSDLEVPKDREEAAMAAEIPVTYVPARNTVFLSVALGWAEVLGARDIYVGVNAVDYSGYPDCRPEFLQAFETLANLATKAGVEGDRFSVHAPLIDLTKAEIIRLGLSLNVDYGLTHSCYDPVDGQACGRCDSCRLRLAGFKAAGATDPAPYAARPNV
ncbi:7-cyano-7-deazaguanine synthase QueC [Alienimonas sp. DA493]|uniref:7-cyano-7-deazaguanine synthase QueC n=1 Tax=Alienimonas sp. DA493 TaxID=3373605 RepID=UPI003754E3F1